MCESGRRGAGLSARQGRDCAQRTRGHQGHRRTVNQRGGRLGGKRSEQEWGNTGTSGTGKRRTQNQRTRLREQRSLPDWSALVAPQVRDLCQGAAELWTGPRPSGPLARRAPRPVRAREHSAHASRCASNSMVAQRVESSSAQLWRQKARTPRVKYWVALPLYWLVHCQV